MDACLPGYIAAEATAATKVETRERKGGESEGGGGRERKNGRIWESARRREQDEKCNYDFEKWARPPSRKRTSALSWTTGSRFRAASRVSRLDLPLIGNCEHANYECFLTATLMELSPRCFVPRKLRERPVDLSLSVLNMYLHVKYANIIPRKRKYVNSSREKLRVS